MARRLVGVGIGVCAVAVLAAAMFPIRGHIAIATAALVLVVPVVLGAALGGWVGGFATVVAGFLVYDYVFIPPYYTLTVGSLENWSVLGVYAVVMLLVARLVAHLQAAQERAESRLGTTRRLLDITELLLSDRGVVADAVVQAVQRSFEIEDVALLQASNGELAVVAEVGPGLSSDELERLTEKGKEPVALTTGRIGSGLQALALSSSGRPVGLLVLRNPPESPALREALPLLANQLAIALERNQLQSAARRAELLEEVDRLRQALVGAVSHDLRSPLATIKVAITTLSNPAYDLPASETAELRELIEQQTDRLSRLVDNLLDFTRIQSGALEVRPKPVTVGELVEEAVASLGTSVRNRPIELPDRDAAVIVLADDLLVSQVLANLLENADRHAPEGHPVVIRAREAAEREVVISVDDDGPGVPLEERASIFETFVRFDTGGRSGLGLAIAKAFLAAHGRSIWVEESPTGGARFNFDLPSGDFPT